MLLVNGEPFDVSWPLIEKDWRTETKEGAEMVRVVFAAATVVLGVFA